MKPFLTHDRDVVGDYQRRFLIHIPMGFLMGIDPLSRGLNDLFVAYEENEDLHVKDEAWKDYAGCIAGFIIGRATLIGLAIWLILKWVGG